MPNKISATPATMRIAKTCAPRAIRLGIEILDKGVQAPELSVRQPRRNDESLTRNRAQSQRGKSPKIR